MPEGPKRTQERTPGARTLRGVVDVASGLLSDLDTEVVLGRVLEAARGLAGARYAALGVLDETRTGLARFITAGISDEERRKIGALPKGRGVLGELITHPVPLRLDDVERHPRSYGFPPGHPPMQSFLGAPVLIGGEPFGNLYLTDKEGGAAFTDEDEEALVVLAEFAGIAIDHARRFTGSEARREELQETVAALDATIEVTRAVGGETDLGTILELVSKRGRALVSARVLVIELVEGDEVVVAAGAGELPAGIVGQRMRLADTVASAALRARQSQHLADELNRARFDQHGLGRLGVRAEGGLVVPLIFQGRVYGVLVAVDRLTEGPSFTQEDQRLLEAFATSAATAVATAKAVADERRLHRLAASEEERGRWARELHDETLQGLGGLRIALANACESSDPRALREAVAGAIEELDVEIAGLRALITDLRPAALDQLGVGPAVEALAERAGRNDLDVDLAVDFAYEQGRKPDRLAPELETGIYRIVQEALTNARKHGGARRAIVEVTEDDATVSVRIRDDGEGFDTTAPTEGFGLIGMRERAQILGGELKVESALGQGTSVSATLPLRRRSDPSSTPASSRIAS